MQNRREFHRLPLFTNVTIEIVDEDGNKHKGYILDISSTGIRVALNYNTSFKKSKVSFKLSTKEFIREAEVVRYTTDELTGRELLAMNFINIKEKEKQELFQSLIVLEAKQINPE